MQRPRRAVRRRRIHRKRCGGSAAIREVQNAGAVNCRVQLVPGRETCDLQDSVHGQRRSLVAEIRAFPNERSRGNRQRLFVARAERVFRHRPRAVAGFCQISGVIGGEGAGCFVCRLEREIRRVFQLHGIGVFCRAGVDQFQRRSRERRIRNNAVAGRFQRGFRGERNRRIRNVSADLQRSRRERNSRRAVHSGEFRRIRRSRGNLDRAGARQREAGQIRSRREVQRCAVRDGKRSRAVGIGGNFRICAEADRSRRNRQRADRPRIARNGECSRARFFKRSRAGKHARQSSLRRIRGDGNSRALADGELRRKAQCRFRQCQRRSIHRREVDLRGGRSAKRSRQRDVCSAIGGNA